VLVIVSRNGVGRDLEGQETDDDEGGDVPQHFGWVCLVEVQM
jgi:hypothetical protein